MLLPFEELPSEFQNENVKKYYDILYKKRKSLYAKRLLDLVLAFFITIIVIIPIIVIAIIVKCTSRGPIFYRQVRVTKYNKTFKIYKFRTMVKDADKMGTLVTEFHDPRVTSVGEVLRKYRLDELPQIFNVLKGEMSIVGTRPEVPKYVKEYKDEYYATLLMPAGITSLASIKFKNEENLLKNSADVDGDYINIILPKKMHYNLLYIKRFGVKRDLSLMFRTVKEVSK